MSKPTEVVAETREARRPLRSLEIHLRFADTDRTSALTERYLYEQAQGDCRTGRQPMDGQDEGNAGNQDQLLNTPPLSSSTEPSIEN